MQTPELNKNNLREFLNQVFERISVRYNLCKNYQAGSVKFGKAFEACFNIIMERLFPNILLTPHVSLPEACMTTGSEADFGVMSIGSDQKIIAVIETKGSADYIICNGKRRSLRRPGLLRTDTVKKPYAMLIRFQEDAAKKSILVLFSLQ